MFNVATIVASAAYLPPRRVLNSHFEGYLDTSDPWIFERTGIKERRWADAEVHASDMGVIAAKEALDKAGILPQDVDFILVATMTPDQLFPSTAALIQSKLEGCRAPGMDISAACSGYLYGLSVAKAFIESNAYKTILFIGTEKMTQVLDPMDRSTVILFGDGAGASVIRAGGKGLRIDRVILGLDGELNGALHSLPNGKMKMAGQGVFKTAIQRGAEMIETLLEEEKIVIDQIDHVVFHQANIRIIQNIQKRFSIPQEKIPTTIEFTANTSAASIPILLNSIDFEEGQRTMSIAFGAGFTYAGALFTSL
ncbi:MAG: 3-oxoacyl-ACP synthase III family protein [Chlamydiia bacterium]